MTIKITHSKTDQLCQGDTVVIVRSGFITCPVIMLEKYLARTVTVADDRRFLFRQIQSTKNGESLRNSGKISYSCLAEYFKKKLKSLCFLAELFGLHSLRSGHSECWGAWSAYKRHWQVVFREGYVRLTVSKTLGLYPSMLLRTWLPSLWYYSWSLW